MNKTEKGNFLNSLKLIKLEKKRKIERKSYTPKKVVKWFATLLACEFTSGVNHIWISVLRRFFVGWSSHTVCFVAQPVPLWDSVLCSKTEQQLRRSLYQDVYDLFPFHQFVTSAARISRYRQILNGWNSHASTSVRRLMSVWCLLLMWILFIKMNSWDVPTGLSLRLWLTGKYIYVFFFQRIFAPFPSLSLFFFRSDKLLIAHEIWKNNVCKKLKHWFIDVGPVVWWSADRLQIAGRCELWVWLSSGQVVLLFVGKRWPSALINYKREFLDDLSSYS